MYTLAIVDDDELIRLGLKSVVNWERLGFEVIGVYPNALEALEVLRKTTVDVVLTDIKMPQMSGLELIEQAKKYNPQIRSIVISGYSEFELAQKALQLGVDDYLLKPLGQERINTTFSNLKLSLDNSDLVSSDDGKYLKAEYKLMKLLSQKIYVEPLFENENILELVAIKFMPHFETAGVREQLGICMEYVAKNMLPYVHLLHQDILVVLLPQELLNSYLVEIKKELLHYSNISYCLAVGKEAYSKEEIISSYWTAMELIKEHQEPQRNCIIYYETKDSMNRKDWQFVQSMQEELIKDIENRMSGNVEVTLKALNDKMLTFKTEDVYYYYSNIVARLIKYFKIQGEHNFIYGGRQFYCVEEEKKLEILQRDFNQDIGNILRILHENSDTMQNFIVNNSKKIIYEEYSNSELTLASIANKLNVSYGYLSTIFTKSMGKSFKSFLVDVRMENARQLLLSRQHKVYEISELVGYSNPRYFTDSFKKYYHCSPTDYISKFRGESEWTSSDEQPEKPL